MNALRPFSAAIADLSGPKVGVARCETKGLTETIHAPRRRQVPWAELATYVVEKGKPLVVLARCANFIFKLEKHHDCIEKSSSRSAAVDTVAYTTICPDVLGAGCL